MTKDFLQIPDAIDEELQKRNDLQKFCAEIIMPKLSREKRSAVTCHMENGIDIDGAMALENIKITVC